MLIKYNVSLWLFQTFLVLFYLFFSSTPLSPDLPWLLSTWLAFSVTTGYTVKSKALMLGSTYRREHMVFLFWIWVTSLDRVFQFHPFTWKCHNFLTQSCQVSNEIKCNLMELRACYVTGGQVVHNKFKFFVICFQHRIMATPGFNITWLQDVL